MNSLDITIVHPWDPWDQGIGGFESCLDGFLRYAPPSWKLELVGLTRNSVKRPIGKWVSMSFAGRQIRFLAVLGDTEPDRVQRIPLSLRFAFACRLHHIRTEGQIVQFHRFESALGVTVPARTRQVYFIHNHPEEIQSSYSDVRWHGFYQLHNRLLLRQLQRASAVVSVDPRTPAWIAAHTSDSQVQLVYQSQWADPDLFHCIDLESRARERLKFRAVLGAAPDAKVILFAGRLERQKDPILLLEAFEVLHQNQPDIWLAIVGKGRLEDSMKSKARELRIMERVGFLGAVTREEMAALYRGADVLACTSGFEAGPRTIFESLACGTPVVSLDVGQASQVLRDHPQIGRLVEQRNPEAIAQALEEVLKQDLSLSKQAGCAEAVAGFTPHNGLLPIFDLYDCWLDQSQSKEPAGEISTANS